MTPACPHSGGGVVVCARCLQGMVEPPVQRSAIPAERSAPKIKRPKAWRLIAADGQELGYYERVSKGTARRAYRLQAGKQAPPGSHWEGVR
jgi:hypothetical protein